MKSSKINAVHFPRKTGTDLFPVDRFGPENAKQVRAFHKSFPSPLPAGPAPGSE